MTDVSTPASDQAAETVPASPAPTSSATSAPVSAPGVVTGRRRRGRHRAKIAFGAGAAVVVAAAAGVAAIGFGGTDNEPATAAGLPPATSPVTRATLVETEKVNGTLGYGDRTTVAARGSGTITWLPSAGSTLGRGKTLYRMDDKPVVLLLGTLPLYRPLASGNEGSDVKQLEQNLHALGYRGFTVDAEFDSETDDAVREWQEDVGWADTGRVDPAQVVVTAGPVRIADLTAQVGDPASGPVLTYSGTTRRVDIDLDVAKQHLVRKGGEATVTLPNGTDVKGRVDSVGTVAVSSGNGATGPGAGGGGDTTTIEVVVAVSDQKALGTLDSAPVTLTLVADRRDNVLTVPIGALVALAEGGYGVQIVEGSATRYVAVETGMFAGGRVEVTSGGLTEGQLVGIPK